MDDLKERLQKRVTRCTGWKRVTVNLSRTDLTVDCETGCLLHYVLPQGVHAGKEAYGRLRNIGITEDLLTEIDALSVSGKSA